MADPLKEAKVEAVEAVVEVVKEVAAEVREQRAEIKVEVKSWLALQPLWAKVLLVAAALGGYYLWERYVTPDLPRTKVTVNNVLPEPQPPMVAKGTAVAEDAKAGHRLFARVLRTRLRERLQKDGFALIGGDPKPLDAATANNLVNRLDDDVIVAAAVQYGALGDGSLLDRLGDALKWLIDHKEQILKLLSILLSLLAVFADLPVS